MTSSQRDTNITLALLLLIFGFWLWGLEWLHMRPDEHLVYMHTDYDSVVGAVTYQATRDVQAPLWHSFFWTWRQLVGDSEFAGRYQGVLWSTITLAMLYRLLHDTFDAPRYGWLAMTFVAVNAHFFTYAFEIRPYPIVLLGSVFSAWCLLRWLDSPTWGRALRYGGSLALLAYTHYFTAFWVAAQWIYAAFQPSARRAWQQLAGATLLAGAVWGIWFPVFLGQVAALRRIDGTFGIGSTTTATSWSVIEQLALLASNGLPLLLIALFAVGLFTVRRREYAFLLLWAVGAPAIALTANLFASVYDTRYVVYMSLGVGAATAVSLGSLRRVWLPLSLVVMALMLWRLPSHLPDREPYRTIFQGMSAASHPDDLLFFDEADLERSYVRWLLNQYTDPILLENGTLDFDEAAHARRVWHITSKLLDPDVQSNFRELERTRPLTEVFGACTKWCYVVQLLEGAPLTEPVPFTDSSTGDVLPFYGGEVMRTEDNLDVRLWWMPDTSINYDYAVSVRLVAEDGTLLSQTDGPPLVGGVTRNTSTLETDRMILDERHLAIPSDLSPGNYDIQMVVYDPLRDDVLVSPYDNPLTLDTITVS